MTSHASLHLRRRRAGVSLALSAAAFGLVTAPAGAAVTRTTISGPSADLQLAVQQKVDVDVAPDGSAAIAWRQKVAGVDHAFVSRYVGGVWEAPKRVDTGLAGASRQPAVAVSNGGRTLVLFPQSAIIGQEQLYAAVAPDGSAAFGAPIGVQLDPAGWKDIDLDVAPNGNGYFTVYQGFHLRAYRVEGTTFTPIGAGFPGADGILNASTAEQAESGDQRGAHLAVDSTGSSATFAWSETNGAAGYKTFARKVSGTAKGTAVDATIPALDGKPAAGGANDMTSVSVGGDGKAWVAFREAFTYGATDKGRALVRAFDGTTFGPAQVIDGLGDAPAEAAEFPRLATNASGAGLAANYRQLTFGTEASTLAAGGTWATGTLANPSVNTAPGRASVALGDAGVGLVSMYSTPGATKQVLGRIAGGPANGTVETLSDPTFGDAGHAYETGAGGGYAITAFQQGSAATSRIVAAVVPLPTPPAPTPPTNGGGGEGGAQQPTGNPQPAPALTKLKLRSKSLTATSAAPKLVTAKSKTRSLSFVLDRAAAVDLTVTRVKTGKLVGGKCTSAKGKSVRKKDRCALETPVKGSTTLQALAGTNHVKFGGRPAAGKRLAPGTYAVYAVARDAAGAAEPVRAAFTVKSTR